MATAILDAQMQANAAPIFSRASDEDVQKFGTVEQPFELLQSQQKAVQDAYIARGRKLFDYLPAFDDKGELIDPNAEPEAEPEKAPAKAAAQDSAAEAEAKDEAETEAETEADEALDKLAS